MGLRFGRVSVCAVLLVVLSLSGCRWGREAQNGPQAPSEPALVWDPAKAITPETVGKPVLRLRLGETVAYADGKATFAMRVNSFSKAATLPKQKDKEYPNRCAVVWVANATVTIMFTGAARDYDSFATYAFPYALLGGLTPEAQRRWYDRIPLTVESGPDDLNGWVLHTRASHTKRDGLGPFTKTGSYYLPVCVREHDELIPWGQSPLGVALLASPGTDVDKSELAAQWLL